MAKVSLTNEQRAYVRTWELSNPLYRALSVVFEITSSETFVEDLGYKLNRYRSMRVEEYFIYDPSVPQPAWDEKDIRLKGWYFINKAEQPANTHLVHRDWLWSEILQRWLVPAEHKLHLYDNNGKRELSNEELYKLAMQEMRKSSRD